MRKTRRATQNRPHSPENASAVLRPDSQIGSLVEQQQVKWCGAILICGGEQGSPSVPERSLTEVLTEPISSSASTEESGFTWAEPSSPPQKSFIHQLGAFTIVRILLVSARWVFPEERCISPQCWPAGSKRGNSLLNGLIIYKSIRAAAPA